ncbi:Malate:quinone oxidoreductase [Granulibacter bethesdensis]|uniref:Probable malate:quinone oxidoreductase n=1 Tax=Granulibacter bethesdensis TaxID=364410 RepID=A0AAN0RDL8_9PROT|nr:malate dehydrogenase (quinone) [Granulibacter bethesdensis]AHJ62882.1 Malate:quinone oxidoreductase [Granulibacter bethesdensis]
MTSSANLRPDIVLIGAGIMGATFGTLLKELNPSYSMMMFERLSDCGQESSQSWNNAGTGHAANCELNYTPQRPDGTVEITQALKVNTEFDLSRQLWSYLVTKGAIPDPQAFIHPCPHMSMVWGAENVAFLKARFQAMSAHHCYHGMEYTEDGAQIEKWAPLTMEGRDPAEPVAATRIITGTDVDYGSLTHLLVAHLKAQPDFDLHYNTEVEGLDREPDGRWRVTFKDVNSGERHSVSAGFVFIGAGGASIDLLQKSNIPEGKGYGGFPVSGIWLRCDVDAVTQRHHAKVYGKASSGSPPMSVPHLDTRVIDGKTSLLFGPYAGFSTKFLKHGSLTDLFGSITLHNIGPLLDVGRHNIELTEYLIAQVLQTHHHQFEMLKAFFPNAKRADWKEAVAGQRVQVIKPYPDGGGFLEFGTEIVPAADHSLVALLGASPGASTAAAIALEVLEACFADRLTDDAWLPALKRIIPTYGIDLREDAEACRASRAATASVLNIDNI